ncbi:MAG: AAA family ATPase [Clostridiales Family XIII bacterium]|jgi:hypothetical protein|nr:AAA family ATPase [Clostridiales Family XIII bacterium]
MKTNLVGRKNEIGILTECYQSAESEFVAIYGRRRIGKTFLVKELFENDFAFFAEGILDGNQSVQLKNFNDEIANYRGKDFPPAPDWLTAFNNLNRLIEASPQKGKKVIFLDEIPSMATKNAGFLPALAHFWNRWAQSRKDVLLIICGSATAWIIKNIVGNKGGLHNRLTHQIMLQPFTLKECEAFFHMKNILFTRYQIAESYMIFGGVPYYMKFMKPELSFHQNVDALYFDENAPLRSEYRFLYRSLFADSQGYIKIVEALSSKSKGLTRKDISGQTGLANSGRLTERIQELIHCGFVREYLAFNKKERNRLYQLIDPFTIFSLRFSDKRKKYAQDFWLHFSATPAHSAWSGFAFERVCLQHVPQIRKALGITGMMTEVSSWRSETTEPGAQIDLVIDRVDNMIHLCEAKYASTAFKIDKAYAGKLRSKRDAFMQETKTQKSAHTTMITTFGLKRNEYANEIMFQMTLDELFE